MDAEISVYIEGNTGSAALGVKVQGGGCGNLYNGGFFLRIDYYGLFDYYSFFILFCFWLLIVV